MPPDLLNNAVFSEVDANNTSGSQPTWPENMLAKNVNNAARALQGAIKRWADQIAATLTSAGTATAYTLTYSVAPDALYNGQRFFFTAHVTNSAGTNLPTVNVNGLGAKVIRKILDGVVTPLQAGDMQANTPVELMYSAGSGIMILLNSNFVTAPSSSLPQASESVSGINILATIAEILSGAAVDDGVSVKNLGNLLKKGSDVAGTTNIILGAGSYFNITGSGWSASSIAFSDSSFTGRKAQLIFAGTGTLVNGASLVLPTAANIAVLAGDTAEVILDTGGVYRIVNYLRSNGQSVAGNATVGWTDTFKTADETRTTTTFSNDADLSFVASANKTTDYEYFFIVNPQFAGGIKLQLTQSAAPTSHRALATYATDASGGPDLAGLSFSGTGTLTIFGATFSSGTGLIIFRIKGTIVCGASPVTVRPQWAQQVASGTSTIRKESFQSVRER